MNQETKLSSGATSPPAEGSAPRKHEHEWQPVTKFYTGWEDVCVTCGEHRIVHDNQSAELLNRVILMPGYHWCANPNCKTQLSDGAPELCPGHEAIACPKCKGRGQIVWSHNEAETPSVKYKTCKTCGGSGQNAKVSDSR